MKPFLGIDLTFNKRNNQIYIGEFLIQTPSLALNKSLKSSSERAEETLKSSKLLLPFRIAQFVCGMSALIIVHVMLKLYDSFELAYKTLPWLFWVVGVCAVVWVILSVGSKMKAKSVLETDESFYTFSHLNKVTDTVYKELGVPANAQDADVLSFYYKVENGQIKAVNKNIVTHKNHEFKVFSDDKNLYLATTEGKFAFPLSSLIKIHTINKRICIAKWNKTQDIKSGAYKKYKLTYGENGSVNCKCYHILEINHNGEAFGIYFPCYELPVFEEYLGNIS